VKYELIYTRRAENDIRKLEAAVRERIGKTLLRYREDPLKYAEKLSNPILGEYRFRIGDYRVIFDMTEDVIIILRVGHRREIYKRS
jgi:mRNA interferase RelE/StbE